MSAATKRLFTLGSLVYVIFDFATDIWTVSIYYQEQSLAIRVISTISILFGAMADLIMIGMLLYYIGKDKKEGKESANFATVRLVAIITESLPQLLINLYILSICGQVIQDIQYVSAVASFGGICFGIVKAEAVFAEKLFDREFNARDYILLYILQGMFLAARISVLLYFAFYLSWYTVIFLLIHSAVVGIILNFAFGNLGKRECDGLKKKVKKILAVIGSGIIFVFLWISYGEPLAASFYIIFAIGNGIAFAISYNIHLFPEDFCLYASPLDVNVALNVTAVICLILFCVLKKNRLNNKITVVASNSESSLAISSYNSRQLPLVTD